MPAAAPSADPIELAYTSPMDVVRPATLNCNSSIAALSNAPPKTASPPLAEAARRSGKLRAASSPKGM